MGKWEADRLLARSGGVVIGSWIGGAILEYFRSSYSSDLIDVVEKKHNKMLWRNSQISCIITAVC